MNASVVALALALCFVAPSLGVADDHKPTSQPVKPAASQPVNKVCASCKPIPCSACAKKAMRLFCEALSAGETAKAKDLTGGVFHILKGRVQTLEGAPLTGLLEGRFGRRIARDYGAALTREKGVRVYGSGARAAKTAKSWPAFEGCTWIGLARPDGVKKPFALKLVKGRVVVFGFHDD